MDPVRHPPALDVAGRDPEIGQAAVGARPDEHPIRADVLHARPGRETHVFEGRATHASLSFSSAASAAFGTVPSIPVTMAGLVPQVTCGARPSTRIDTCRSNAAPGSVGRVRQKARAAFQSLPGGRGERAAREVVERRLVGGHHAGAGARLDGHVAHRHPFFHGHRPDGFAGVLDHAAGSAADPEPADEGEDHVLRMDPRRPPPVQLDQHGSGAALE